MIDQFVIFLPMFVSLVLATIWALDMATDWRPQPLGSQWGMMAFLVACTLLYLGHAVYFGRHTSLIPLTDSIYSFCSPAVFPLYYIYVCELTGSPARRLASWGWLLPSVVCGVAVGVCYVLMDDRQTADFIDNYLYLNDWSALSGMALAQVYAHWLLKLVFGVQIIPIALLGIRRINHFSDMLERWRSDVTTGQLMMVKLLFVLFVITTVLSAFSNFIGRNRFVGDPLVLAIPSTLFSVLIFLQVYIAMRQQAGNLAAQAVGLMEESEVEREMSEVRKDEAAERMRELRGRIEQLMDNDKVFLQNGLKISDLAGLLCCNRNYIYRAINVEMGISFSEYVNKKRVEYAKQLMQKNPDLQMNELYMKAGFASSSSFYRCFRQYVGCTPKEFLDRR